MMRKVAPPEHRTPNQSGKEYFAPTGIRQLREARLGQIHLQSGLRLIFSSLRPRPGLFHSSMTMCPPSLSFP